jgi:hypothetical protein
MAEDLKARMSYIYRSSFDGLLSQIDIRSVANT